jgi:hypothetical protein
MGVVSKHSVSIITGGTGQTHNYDVVTQLQTFHNRNAAGSRLEGE